jgi:hypothetical protein
MRLTKVALALSSLVVLGVIVGCDSKASIPQEQQKAFEDRNKADFHGVPPGFGHGGSPPPGKGPSGPPPGATPGAGG